MKTLVIINAICTAFIIGRWLIKNNRFYFYITKTTWMKKHISLTLMYRYRISEYGSSSKGIITIPLVRNYNKWENWDSACFYNGKYKRNK